MLQNKPHYLGTLFKTVHQEVKKSVKKNATDHIST